MSTTIRPGRLVLVDAGGSPDEPSTNRGAPVWDVIVVGASFGGLGGATERDRESLRGA